MLARNTITGAGSFNDGESDEGNRDVVLGDEDMWDWGREGGFLSDGEVPARVRSEDRAEGRGTSDEGGESSSFGSSGARSGPWALIEDLSRVMDLGPLIHDPDDAAARMFVDEDMWERRRLRAQPEGGGGGGAEGNAGGEGEPRESTRQLRQRVQAMVDEVRRRPSALKGRRGCNLLHSALPYPDLVDALVEAAGAELVKDPFTHQGLNVEMGTRGDLPLHLAVRHLENTTVDVVRTLVDRQPHTVYSSNADRTSPLVELHDMWYRAFDCSSSRQRHLLNAVAGAVAAMRHAGADGAHKDDHARSSLPTPQTCLTGRTYQLWRVAEILLRAAYFVDHPNDLHCDDAPRTPHQRRRNSKRPRTPHPTILECALSCRVRMPPSLVRLAAKFSRRGTAAPVHKGPVADQSPDDEDPSYRDEEGRTPLARAALSTPPFRWNRNKHFALYIELFPNCASMPDSDGRLPLHLALENQALGLVELQILIGGGPSALVAQDPKTGLYPFMLPMSSLYHQPRLTRGARLLRDNKYHESLHLAQTSISPSAKRDGSVKINDEDERMLRAMKTCYVVLRADPSLLAYLG